MEMLGRNCHLLQALGGQFVDRICSHQGDALLANVKEPQNPSKLVVAATFEMAKT